MSGSDNRALNLGRIFMAKGYEVMMIIPELGMDRFKGFSYIKTLNDKPLGNLGLIISYFRRAIKASGILKKQKDINNNTIIYSSSDLLPDATPAIYIKIKNPSVRWITGLHLIAPNPFKGYKKKYTKGYSLPSISNIYYFLTQRLIMKFMKLFAHTIMVSNSMDREFLIKKGFMPDKVIVTYGAVDRTAIDSAVKKEEGYDACYVGRFHKQKGFPDLIEAWKQVCKKCPKAVIAIIGNDINLHAVIKKVASEGMVDNIKFLGFLNGIDKFNVMKSSKICVFPSTHESFGMVAAEAMASGLPVVAYDLPIFREIYPVGMLKSPIGDVNKLANNIIDLLQNDDKRIRISEEAFKLSKKFSWEKTAESILERLN